MINPEGFCGATERLWLGPSSTGWCLKTIFCWARNTCGSWSRAAGWHFKGSAAINIELARWCMNGPLFDICHPLKMGHTLIPSLPTDGLVWIVGGGWCRGDMPHATSPTISCLCHAFPDFPKGNQDWPENYSTPRVGTQGHVPKVMRILHFTLLSFLIIETTSEFLKGKGLEESHTRFCSVLFYFGFCLFLFPTHHKFFSPPLIVWAKCWKLRPVFHPPSTSPNTSWPGSHQEYWPIRIRRIFLC